MKIDCSIQKFHVVAVRTSSNERHHKFVLRCRFLAQLSAPPQLIKMHKSPLLLDIGYLSQDLRGYLVSSSTEPLHSNPPRSQACTPYGTLEVEGFRVVWPTPPDYIAIAAPR